MFRVSRNLSILAAGLSLSACAAIGGGGAMSLESVGNRADLISGGDVLVRADLPARLADQAVLSLNGVALDGALHPAADGDGYLALVRGLKVGENFITLATETRGVQLDIVNHPDGGPLFSGPQIQPWTCMDDALNDKCARPASVEYFYMPQSGDGYVPYDLAEPQANVGLIDVGGQAMLHIVRVERFTQNRSGVAVATLYDPRRPWEPWAPQPQWNGGVFVLQGAGCGTGFEEREAGDPLNERALSRGLVVVTVALLHNTINCNPVVQAESAIMAKEHVAETYGPIAFTFGMGSSGGAISQINDQNAYPGIYDGMIVNHLFADSDASRMNGYDCKVLYDAWARPEAPAWTEDQKAAVAGMLSGCDSHVRTTRYEVYNPAVGTNCTIPEDQRFDVVARPNGVRCALQDYEVNQVGTRPDGYANGRIDTVGVQFGLEALLAGTISPEQFADLNAAIGGHDINFQRTAARTQADAAGLSRLYSTGINNTASNLAETAVIETRLEATDFHQVYHAVMMRERLTRAQGHAENWALWRSTARREAAFDAAFDVMVEWIDAIKTDERNVPKAQKVIDNRPDLARDRCLIDGEEQGDASACPAPPKLARTLAGAPDTNDIGKCQLKPLDRSDYPGVSFTDDQWTRLQGAFPSGVCDYSKPLVDFQVTTPWLTYLGDGVAEPLGPVPTSYPVE
jgi:hypothetical protein